MKSFLASLVVKIIEVVFKKIADALEKYNEYRKEKKRAGEFKEVVDKPGSTRDERRKAEDDYYG